MALEFQRSISRKSLIASTVSQTFMIKHPQDWEWDYISPLRSSNGMTAGFGWKAPKAKGPPFSFPFPSRNTSSTSQNAQITTWHPPLEASTSSNLGRECEILRVMG